MLFLACAHDHVQLCVKRPEDIPRAVQTIIDNNATDRAFLEIKIPDFVALYEKAPNWDQVYVLAEAGSLGDITTLFSGSKALLERAFTFEFDPSYTTWGINVTQVIEVRRCVLD